MNLLGFCTSIHEKIWTEVRLTLCSGQSNPEYCKIH